MEKLPDKTLEALIERQGKFEDDVNRRFANVDSQIQGLYVKMEEGFNAVDRRFERLETKVDQICIDMKQMSAEMRQMSSEMRTMNTKFDARLTILEDSRH